MNELEEKLLKAIEKFKAKIEERPEYRAELADWKRNILIDAGEEQYHFTIDNAEVRDFGSGPVEPADISVTAEKDTLIGMLDGTISPMKAYAKKQLKLKAPLADLLKIRKFF